jgi:hypothetical protein
MEKFVVSICRTSYAWRDIEINATNKEEATAAALDICGNYEYSEKDSEYRIEQITQE